MKFTELKKDIDGGAKPVYLLQGEELYFIDKGSDMLLSAFLTEPQLNYAAFEGSYLKTAAGAEEFIASLSAYPFLSGKRVVRVREFYPTEREFERVKDVFLNPIESAVLIITNTGKGGAGAVDLKKQPSVAYVDCAKASREDVIKWIFITLKREGVRLDTYLCEKVAEYCSYSMSRIAIETEKLLSYAESGGVLNEEAIDSLINKETDYKIYELTQAAAKKNYTLFTSIMYEMLLKGFDKIGFLSAIGAYYKSVYMSGVFSGTNAEAAEFFGKKEYAVKKDREQAAAIGVEKAGEYSSYFYSLTQDIKCGNLSDDAALVKAVAEIFFD